MSSENEKLKTVLDGLMNVRRSIESVRLVLEYGDLDATVLIAHRTILRFRKLIDQVKSENSYNENFLSMIEKNRMPQLSDDIHYFSSVLDTEKFDSSEMTDRVTRLENYTRIFRKELSSMYTIESEYAQFFRRYKKPLLLGTSTVIGLFLLIKGVDSYRAYGHGLKGEYFRDRELSRLYRTRIDRKIDFRWGKGSALKGFPSDRFSIRWTGFVKASEQGIYEFTTQSDDGVRLWINDQQIINDWNNHGVKPNRGQIELPAGWHRIKLEYYDHSSFAVVRLLWKYGKMIRPEIIPMKFFAPEDRYAS